MKFLRTKNKEIKICYINIIMPIIGYFIFVLTFVCHVQFNLIDSTTLLPTKKKKAHMRNRSSNSNLTVFKAGNFPNFDTTCYTARVSVYNESIDHPALPYTTLLSLIKVWSTVNTLRGRKIAWKHDGWYRFVGIRHCSTRYHRRNWIPFAVICLRFGAR